MIPGAGEAMGVAAAAQSNGASHAFNHAHMRTHTHSRTTHTHTCMRSGGVDLNKLQTTAVCSLVASVAGLSQPSNPRLAHMLMIDRPTPTH